MAQRTEVEKFSKAKRNFNNRISPIVDTHNLKLKYLVPWQIKPNKILQELYSGVTPSHSRTQHIKTQQPSSLFELI